MVESKASILLAIPEHKLHLMPGLLGGAYVFYRFPPIELKPLIPLPEYPKHRYDLIILSSEFGAKIFFENYLSFLRPDQAFGTVGPSVSLIVERHGFKVSVEPKSDYQAEGLFSELESSAGTEDEEVRFLLIGSEDSALLKYSEALKKAGARLDQLTIYHADTIQRPHWGNWRDFISSRAALKLICLTSPKAAHAFFELIPPRDLSAEYKFVCLGDRCGHILRANSVSVHQANSNSYASLAERIEELASTQQ